jgi:uncharacterized protein YjbI with pentapeptide repeats
MATAPDAPLAPRPPDPIDTELDAPPSARGVVVAEGTLKAPELAGHNLSEGRLVDVRIDGGSLANADARRSELRRVEVIRCRATGCGFAEATLADVVFDDCRLDLSSFRFATLERVVFRDCRLEEADFCEAKLQSVLLERCTLVGATLDGVTVERVELRGCDLEGSSGAASLRGARMPWSDIVGNAGTFAAAIGIVAVD